MSLKRAEIDDDYEPAAVVAKKVIGRSFPRIA
jgi:hypothetical protein